jgi:hypothetical protein
VGPSEHEEPGVEALALRFGPLPTADLRALEALVEELSASEVGTAGPAEGVPGAPAELPAFEPADARGAERRAGERRAYGRRVIALGEESARVVLGRDLSPGGMRVEPTSKLALGEQLQLALHLDPGRDPLVVSARVERDDGPQGLLLRFSALSPAADSYLAEMLGRLPPLSALGEKGQRVPLVVSEILRGSAPIAIGS